MKYFFLLLQLTILESIALVDISILAQNNSWEYEKVHTSGRTEDVTFFGKTSVKIDSLVNRNDSFFIWSSWRDSAYSLSQTRTYKTEHAIVNGKVSQVFGDWPGTDLPFYLIGSDLTDTLLYVRFAGKTRYLNKWIRYPPPMSFGETKSGAYLQGVGALSYKSKTFAMLNQDGMSIQLLKYNGTAFDSTKMELLGPVPLAAEKNRTIPGAKTKASLSWKGNVHGITGRRLH